MRILNGRPVLGSKPQRTPSWATRGIFLSDAAYESVGREDKVEMMSRGVVTNCVSAHRVIEVVHASRTLSCVHSHSSLISVYT